MNEPTTVGDSGTFRGRSVWHLGWPSDPPDAQGVQRRPPAHSHDEAQCGARPKATAAGQHGFGWGDYLPADGLTGSRAEWLDAVLGGRAVNWWMAEDQPLRVAVAARSILVKSVRANGLLDALDHSRACLDPLVVVRHPVATVASQLAEGSWRHPESIDLSGFLRLWPEHADAIAAARRPEEYLTPRIGF